MNRPFNSGSLHSERRIHIKVELREPARFIMEMKILKALIDVILRELCDIVG